MRKVFTITVLMLAINSFAQIPTNGLVGHWPFNGNANDLSNQGNNGVVNGALSITDRFGHTNSAYYFDGNDDFIQMANPGPLGNTSRSISFWAIVETVNTPVASSGQTIFSYGSNTAPNPGKRFRIQANRQCLGMGLEIEEAVFTNYTGINSTNWNHYCFVFDNSSSTNLSSSITMYINGVLQPTNFCNTYNLNTQINTLNTEPITIGKSSTLNHPRYFKGSLDDFYVYNRPLNSSEVNHIYNDGLCYENITVTDTLVINTNFTGFNPVTFENTIKIYPNPTNDHITINFGDNYSTMNGYVLKITNSLSQVVYSNPINTQSTTINLSTWTGNGIYFVHLIDATNNTIDIKKIILQ